MVFSGKPSRACENCRTAHKRCDEKHPACSRCITAKRSCLYRDQLDLGFRDENVRTQNRHHQQQAQRKRLDSGLLKRTGSSSSSLFPTARTRKERAVVYHFYHTVLENLSHEDPVRFLHSWLPILYDRSNPDSALCLATEAISFAASSTLVQGAALISRKRYVEAIKAIGIAIESPFEVGNDETLYAALLLCGYETMIRDPSTGPAWGAHVDGAVALVKIRGTNAGQSPLSRGMFHFVRKSVVIGHMQLCRPVDEIFSTPDTTRDSHESPEERLISKAARIPDLQYRINCLFSKRSDTENDLEALFQCALALDRELSDWTHDVPPNWSYSTATNVNVPARPGFTPTQVHRYADFYVARVWNFYRISRLVTQSILIRTASWLSETTHRNKDEQQAEIERISLSLVGDICASVPFLLGHDLSRMTLAAPAGEHQEPKVEQASPTQPGKFSLIWPLFVACGSPLISDAQRDWMHQQLRFLAEQGETQARFASQTTSRILSGGAEQIRFDCV